MIVNEESHFVPEVTDINVRGYPDEIRSASVLINKTMGSYVVRRATKEQRAIGEPDQA